MVDLQKSRAHLEGFMKSYLDGKRVIYRARHGEEIINAAQDAVMAGGHRWRPLITFGSAYLGSKTSEIDVVPIASAIEFIHSSTLILDDMPFFDNEQTRRGIETIHKKYGPGVASLAQDGLLEWAVDLINENVRGEKKTNIFRVRSEAVDRLLPGQALDTKILSGVQNGGNANYINGEADAVRLYSDKAGSLFVAAALAGAYLRNADSGEIKTLREFGDALGIAYQARDDIDDKDKDIKVALERSGRKDCAVMTPASVLGIGGVQRIRDFYESVVDRNLKEMTGNKDYLQSVVDEMRKTK